MATLPCESPIEADEQDQQCDVDSEFDSAASVYDADHERDRHEDYGENAEAFSSCHGSSFPVCVDDGILTGGTGGASLTPGSDQLSIFPLSPVLTRWGLALQVEAVQPYEKRHDGD